MGDRPWQDREEKAALGFGCSRELRGLRGAQDLSKSERERVTPPRSGCASVSPLPSL